MPASVRATTSVTSDGTASASLAKPSGTAAGDLLILTQIDDSDANAANMTAPSGFVQLGSTQSAGSPGVRKTWTKVAGSSEPSSYTIGTSNSASTVSFLTCVTGQDTTTPVNVSAQDNGSGDPTAPSVTTTVDGCVLLTYFGGARDGGNVTFTPPTGMTEQADAHTGFECGCVDSLVLGTAGATGTKVTTPSASLTRGWLSFTLAIAPASGGSPSPHTGTASGTANWTGSVAGKATHKGTTSSTTTWTGTVAGKTTPKGAASATANWTGTVEGHAPTPDEHDGAASATVIWTGTVAGKTTRKGTAASITTWSGTVAGTTDRSGSVSGSIVWMGSVSGHSGLPPADSGLIVTDVSGPAINTPSVSGVAVHEPVTGPASLQPTITGAALIEPSVTGPAVSIVVSGPAI